MTKRIYKESRKYIKRGWVVHPLHPPDANVTTPGKQPIIKGWQKLDLPSINWLHKHFRYTNNNIGIVCGEKSKLTIIDVDSVTFLPELFFNTKIDTLRSERTKGRGHYYFKYVDGLESKPYKMFGFELLNDGRQVVAPPSTHKSGQKYRFIDETKELQKMPIKQISRNIEVLMERYELLNNVIKECRFWLQNIWKDHMKKHQPNIHSEEVLLAIGAELKANGGTEADMHMFCKIMIPPHMEGTKYVGYDPKYVTAKWRYVRADRSHKMTTLFKTFPIHLQPYLIGESNDNDKLKKINTDNVIVQIKPKYANVFRQMMLKLNLEAINKGTLKRERVTTSILKQLNDHY